MDSPACRKIAGDGAQRSRCSGYFEEMAVHAEQHPDWLNVTSP